MVDWLFLRGNDLTTQFLPDALFFRDSILAGKFPFWNPWIFAGMPYFLDPQNYLWYPPNYLLLLFRSVEFGFLVLLVGHLICAGYFMAKLLEKYPRWTKWLGILFFVLSPKLVGHLEEGNWTLVIAATWLPSLYWALTRQRPWWIVVSLSSLIINNLNSGYYSVLFVLLFFFMYRKRPGLIRPGLVKLLGIVTLLTIPRWLPLVLWGDQTVRAGLSEPPLPFWSWSKIGKSLFFPLASSHPQLQNEEILYFGIIPLLLIVAALATKGRSYLGRSLQGPSFSIRFWAVWLTFILFVAFNVKTPLFPLIQLLPGFSLLRITTRPWIFVALFVALVVPAVLFRLSLKSRLFAVVMGLGVLGEFGIFGYKLFARRVVPVDPLPRRFYERMIEGGAPVRAYCTTGCVDRLMAQHIGIALLHGNNPIQLKDFVQFLQDAAGYHESSYIPILPPYTVFSEEPQPNAVLLGKTATRFVVSPYKLDDPRLLLLDQEGEWRLYENQSDATPYRDHFFGLQKE